MNIRLSNNLFQNGGFNEILIGMFLYQNNVNTLLLLRFFYVSVQQLMVLKSVDPIDV